MMLSQPIKMSPEMSKSNRVQKSKPASSVKSPAKRAVPLINAGRSKPRANPKQDKVARPATATRRRDHRCHHEGDRLAAVFGPRLLCRGPAQKFGLTLESER